MVNVMNTCYITLSAGKSNVILTSVTMQIFIEINLEGDKMAFKRSCDKQNLTLMIISY